MQAFEDRHPHAVATALHALCACTGRMAPGSESEPHQRPLQLRRVALVGDEVLQQVVAGELGCVRAVVAVEHLRTPLSRSAGAGKQAPPPHADCSCSRAGSNHDHARLQLNIVSVVGGPAVSLLPVHHAHAIWRKAAVCRPHRIEDWLRRLLLRLPLLLWLPVGQHVLRLDRRLRCCCCCCCCCVRRRCAVVRRDTAYVGQGLHTVPVLHAAPAALGRGGAMPQLRQEVDGVGVGGLPWPVEGGRTGYMLCRGGRGQTRYAFNASVVMQLKYM